MGLGGSGLLGKIDSYFIVTNIVALLGPTITYHFTTINDDFKDFMLKHLENSFSLIGVEAEDQIQVSVSDQKMVGEDETYRQLMNMLALQHQLTQIDPVDLLNMHTNKYSGRFNNFYEYGKSEYYAGLPTTNIRASFVPIDLVLPIIEDEFGYAPTVIMSDVRTPEKEEWCAYKLWQSHGYLPYDNTIIHNGYVKELSLIDYNYGNNKYDCYFFAPATIQVNTITEVTVTITNIDATTDNKNTHIVVTEETVHSIEGTSYEVVSDTSVNEVIPIDSEVDSYSIDTVYGSTNNIEYDPITISVDAYNLVHHFIIKFYNTNSGEFLYWLYEIGSGNTTLDNSEQFLSYTELLPIVTLRSNTANITGEEYNDAKEILDSIGVNIDDIMEGIDSNPEIESIRSAFIYFGIDMCESNPIIAKILYLMFDELYYQASLSSAKGYAATFTEGVFNASLGWRSQARNVINGSIGVIDTYTNHVVGDNIVIRKQETETEYIEYIIEYVSVTNMISAGSMWDVNIRAPSTTGNCVIPIAKELVYELSPLEQIELFGLSLRLAVFSATVTHLEFYETEEFGTFLKVVAVIVTIVITVLSVGTASGWSWAGFTTLIESITVAGALSSIAVGMAITMAFSKLIDMTDNPYLKALFAAVVVVAAFYFGNYDYGMKSISMVADELVNQVTNYVEELMIALGESVQLFETKLDDRMKELEKYGESMAESLLSTLDVLNLYKLQDRKPTIDSVDLMMYKARDIQYDWQLAKGQALYTVTYDYDKYFKLGVV